MQHHPAPDRDHRRPARRRLSALAGALVLALLPACELEMTLDDYPCPDAGTTLTYDNFGRDFMERNCQGCHASDSRNRQGAPRGYAFDTLDSIRAYRERIFIRAAGKNKTMPPGPDDPPEHERYDLAEWLSCGAP